MSRGGEARQMERLAREGARQLLSRCLPLQRGDVLALFWDSTTKRVAGLLREAARDLDLTLRERYVPVRQQVAFRGELGADDLSAINEAMAIVTCLSSSSRATAFRRELLKVGPNFNNYFGHMPGASLAVLAQAASVDFEAAETVCDDFALALSRARLAAVRTYDFDRRGRPVREHRLDLALTERRLPITSTGVIPRGTWGNIPGGEVFVAPSEGLANGVFSLSGAFLNFVFPPGSSLHLIFEGGALVRFEGKGAAVETFEKLMGRARRHGGAHYRQLAELGIGVNSGVRQLTGSPLLDEKCAGTAHIAIGDNKRYGGSNESNIHEDFITRCPSIELDGKPILKLGENVFDPEGWRDSIFRSERWNPFPDTSAYLAKDRNMRAIRVNGSALQVHQEVASGRICRYTIGDRHSSPLLAALYQMLPERVSGICERARLDLGIPREIVVRGLEILRDHGLANEQQHA